MKSPGKFSVPIFYLIVAFACVPVSAQLNIVGYNSTNPNGPTGAPSPDLPAAEFQSQVTPLLLSRGAGLVPNQGITFNSRDWSLASTLNTSLTDYVQWGWSASTANFNLENMTIQYDRSGSGPTRLSIQLSVNGGAYQSIFDDPDVNLGDETHTINLTSFDDINSASFRLFGYNASSLGGTLDIERFNSDPDPSRAIVVRGFFASVPEPGSLGLIMISLAVTMSTRRRRMAGIQNG